MPKEGEDATTYSVKDNTDFSLVKMYNTKKGAKEGEAFKPDGVTDDNKLENSQDAFALALNISYSFDLTPISNSAFLKFL